jgi:hypothetical protein
MTIETRKFYKNFYLTYRREHGMIRYIMPSLERELHEIDLYMRDLTKDITQGGMYRTKFTKKRYSNVYKEMLKWTKI